MRTREGGLFVEFSTGARHKYFGGIEALMQKDPNAKVLAYLDDQGRRIKGDQQPAEDAVAPTVDASSVQHMVQRREVTTTPAVQRFGDSEE